MSFKDYVWQWLEPDQSVIFVNWGVGQPDGVDGNNCAHMNEGGYWENEACDNQVGYVCRTP